MEELQSTEILDREILEDARKKAWKILKTADDTVKAKAAEWEQKTAAAVGELEKRYAGQGDVFAAEIMARLPMDKRRAQAEKIEGLLRQAVENWYAALRRESLLSLLAGELSRRLAEYGPFPEPEGRPLRVLIHRLEEGEAAAILKQVLPGRGFAVERMSVDYPYPEIILETGGARISASVNKTVDFFLHEKRAELVAALLGEEFPC